MALLLSVDTDIEEQKKIGWLLIGMDVTFLIASIFSIVISILMLRKKFNAIQQRQDKENRTQSVTIVPINEKRAEKKVTEEEEENAGLAFPFLFLVLSLSFLFHHHHHSLLHLSLAAVDYRSVLLWLSQPDPSSFV
jgi:hypothetical protein